MRSDQVLHGMRADLARTLRRRIPDQGRRLSSGASGTMKSKKELEDLIQKETDLIAELGSRDITPEYYLRGDGTETHYPKGDWARHVTETKDAYWRRRNWKKELEILEILE